MIALFECAGCGQTVFPARRLCHRCGGGVWGTAPCERGVIETVTTVRQGEAVALACVLTTQGVRVIVRLEHMAEPGTGVALHEADDGALWAGPGSSREERP